MSALNIDGVCSVLGMLQGYLPFSICCEQPKQESIEQNIFLDIAIVDPVDPAAVIVADISKRRRSHATYVFNGEYTDDCTFVMALATLEEEWMMFMMRNVEPEHLMIVAPIQEYKVNKK
ncbi:uncharacterized protein LOC117585260 [Drosophila guanche]|uniref:uncharacterized protein LOC117585260 n=1 Tax=Drosophila guanche TaxID=7266 RepID=UPI001470B809|nr:uncharacterized protein LOC117585260 [Drosophila guanche]